VSLPEVAAIVIVNVPDSVPLGGTCCVGLLQAGCNSRNTQTKHSRNSPAILRRRRPPTPKPTNANPGSESQIAKNLPLNRFTRVVTTGRAVVVIVILVAPGLVVGSVTGLVVNGQLDAFGSPLQVSAMLPL